ncbi:PLP-dependent aminotransferase family protein [bacterium]|nr:PLP-dependent aminotransferase family protein [candidate division CSSED10-310 bacterium]
MSTFEHLLAERTKRMGASAIREILKVVSQPGMISLAGGFPAPDSFPLELMNELSVRVLEKYGSRALQYDLTEGFIPLREALVGYFERINLEVPAEKILISSGSQGFLDAIGKVLITKGDKIGVEAPTYLGALQAFNPYEPLYTRIHMDEDGVIPESLEETVTKENVKFVYLVPTFQNPSGRTTTLDRRKKIADILQKYNVLAIEDDPYSALRFRGIPVPPLKSFAPEHVVYTGTLSKVLAPGLRIGFIAAPELIRKWLVLAKQGVDLHTSTFNQAIASEYIAGGYLYEHLPKIIQLYKPKQEAMLKAMESHFPSDFKWSRPEGGMFIWAEGPENSDMEKIYWKCVERKVAFVPGKFFFTVKGEGSETMRLNFTMVDNDKIEHAVMTISEILKENL